MDRDSRTSTPRRIPMNIRYSAIDARIDRDWEDTLEDEQDDDTEPVRGCVRYPDEPEEDETEEARIVRRSAGDYPIGGDYWP